MTVEAGSAVDPEIRTLKLSGPVGFDSLPDQLVNKAVSQGFSFNVLCVGETGIGKSTLIETLFNHKFDFIPCTHDLSEPTLNEYTHELVEGNVKLRLTVAETRGFGDQLNREENIKPVIDYINKQYEDYLQEELNLKRTLHSFRDTRVHVCLYFIAPTGHSLKSIDVVTLKALQDKVNVVPVIGKSDTITRPELQAFKARILNEIKTNNIKLYQAPTDDPTISDINSKINQVSPFAVVGSTEKAILGGQHTRVRKYPWGSVQVENESHCDFVRLREMLLRVNMEDLRERTHMVHYEAYRRIRLTEMGYRDDEKMSLQELYQKRRELQQEELQKKEAELRDEFAAKIKEKERELKEAEREIHKKVEVLKQKKIEEARNFEEKRRLLAEEKANFERQKQMIEQSRHSTMKKKK